MHAPRRLAIGLGLAAALAGTSAVTAAPSPDTNKNALLITFQCGETWLVGATIFQNAAVALQVVDGSDAGGGSAVAQMVSLWSYTNAGRTEGEQVWFVTPGFGRNGASTLTCDWWNGLYPDLYWRGELVVHPAT